MHVVYFSGLVDLVKEARQDAEIQRLMGDAMRTTMRAAAVAMLAMAGLLTLSAGSAFAQAASNGCPPGLPSGRPPGTPPNAATPANGRPTNYPAGRCQFGLSQNAAKRGETITATGEGFVPGEPVVLSVGGVRAASALAGLDGRFATQLTVPNSAPIGATTVLATGQSQELSASFEVLGAGAPATGSGTLPRTGDDLVLAAVGGVALIGLGTVAIATTRRRDSA